MDKFVNGLEGMYIGAVDPVLITDDTPLDPDQWEDGKPWHPKKLPNCDLRWNVWGHRHVMMGVSNGGSMCEKCDETVKLLELTRDGKSWVEFTFPNGLPKLVTPEEGCTS